MAKDHGPSIKDDERYEELRQQGMSKEKAARIANTPREEASKKGGESPHMRIGRLRTYGTAPRRSVSKADPTWTKGS